jgi:DNA anti-recombination protein RmuC
MERMAWTDERLEERFKGIDHRFDEVDRRFDEAERQVDRRFEQVGQRFDRVEGEILELRREMHSGFTTLQSNLNRLGAGFIFSLMGVIAAILAKGV